MSRHMSKKYKLKSMRLASLNRAIRAEPKNTPQTPAERMRAYRKRLKERATGENQLTTPILRAAPLSTDDSVKNTMPIDHDTTSTGKLLKKLSFSCRACLSENQGIHNLFMEKCSNGQTYSTVLMKCANITITAEYGLPSCICSSCVVQLESFIACNKADADFVSKCLESNLYLNNIIKDSINKNPSCEQVSDNVNKLVKEEELKDILTEEIEIKEELEDSYFSDAKKDVYNEHDLSTEVPEDPLHDMEIQIENSCNESNQPGYKCNYCNKIFVTESILTNHMKKHTEKKVFKCDYCPKKFSTESFLLKHAQTHILERLHKCTQCEKTFTKESALIIHLQTHSGKRNQPLPTQGKIFKCSHCEKTFTYKDTLISHMRKHTQETLYKCSQCEKVFSHKHVLMGHMKIHSANEKLTDTSNDDVQDPVTDQQSVETVYIKEETIEEEFNDDELEMDEGTVRLGRSLENPSTSFDSNPTSLDMLPISNIPKKNSVLPETEETKDLSYTELKRLVLLEKLELIRLKKRKLLREENSN